MKERTQVIVDHIGRLVVGEVVSETDSALTLYNPVILHVVPDPNTQKLHISSFPYVFMEIISPDAQDQMNWTFNKSQIVLSDVELAESVVAQCKSVNSRPPVISLSEAAK